MGQAIPPQRLALIVESDENRRNMALVLLEESGLDAHAVGTSAQGMTFLSQHAPRIGFLVISETEAESAPGARLAAAATDRYPWIYVVYTGPNERAPPRTLGLGRPWMPLDLLIAAEAAARRRGMADRAPRSRR